MVWASKWWRVWKIRGIIAISKPITTLFLIKSLDGKINSEHSEDLDVDKDWSQIDVKRGKYLMEKNFSVEERRKDLFKRHIQNHLFEYILDFVGPILLTILILYLCKAEEFIYGIILSIAYSAGKLAYNLCHYKKEYVNVDIK